MRIAERNSVPDGRYYVEWYRTRNLGVPGFKTALGGSAPYSHNEILGADRCAEEAQHASQICSLARPVAFRSSAQAGSQPGPNTVLHNAVMGVQFLKRHAREGIARGLRWPEEIFEEDFERFFEAS
jgi:hypothetical protein